MKDLVLSKRMEAVVNMVSPQSFAIADIGCDHAYVSIMLLKRDLTRKVVAMDVRKGPLEIARKNVEAYGMQSQIELRLSDGLEKLAYGEVDTIIIAGMGGLLVNRILERGMDVLSGDKRPKLILQPQSDIREVRIFLYAHAYHIVQETMLIEDGKYYTVMKAEPGEAPCDFSDAEWIYGRYNLEQQDQVLYNYLQKEKRLLEEIFQKLEKAVKEAKQKGEDVPLKTTERLLSVQNEILVNEMAMKYYVNQ
ncbi:MAG: tRNA (adenine(22)-N(1))-methyltransferase [Lachnospiraceae bacterium]